MEVEFMDGGELGNNGPWNSVSTGVPSSPAAAGFSGNYYYARQGGYCTVNVTARDSYYMGIRCKNEGYVFRLYGNNGSTLLCDLRNDSSKLRFYVPNGGVDAWSTYFTDGSVMRVEMYVLKNTYAGATPNSDGTVIVKVNGVEWINRTSVMTCSYNYQMMRFVVGGEWNTWDDAILVVDDWPGNARIGSRVPNAAGSNTNWSKDSGTNYGNVGEIPVNDATYNYINTEDILDTYAISALVETNPITEILAVQATARAKYTGDSTPKDLQLAMKAGTTYDYSANKQVDSDVWRGHNKVWSLNPDTSLPFETDDVFEIGIKSKLRP